MWFGGCSEYMVEKPSRYLRLSALMGKSAQAHLRTVQKNEAVAIGNFEQPRDADIHIGECDVSGEGGFGY
jgi:hypothetical protein